MQLGSLLPVPVAKTLGLLIILFLLAGGCAALKAAVKIASPTVQAGRDQDLDLAIIKTEGTGDSVALWGSIAGLTVVALSAYPAQRKARLVWNSWRGRSGKPETRSGKGKEVCLKFSEWES